MATLNKVQLIGNLTRDPQTSKMPSGMSVTDIALATSRRRKDESGQTHEETTFVDITFFGRTAEIIDQYCSKGRQVYVEGRLKLDTWQDKATGSNRSKLKVIGTEVQFLSSPKESHQSNAPSQSHDDYPA
jgi:single-strand DNA-binding protein